MSKSVRFGLIFQILKLIPSLMLTQLSEEWLQTYAISSFAVLGNHRCWWGECTADIVEANIKSNNILIFFGKMKIFFHPLLLLLVPLFSQNCSIRLYEVKLYFKINLIMGQNTLDIGKSTLPPQIQSWIDRLQIMIIKQFFGLD
jgi:hypothetical protein